MLIFKLRIKNLNILRLSGNRLSRDFRRTCKSGRCSGLPDTHQAADGLQNDEGEARQVRVHRY